MAKISDIRKWEKALARKYGGLNIKVTRAGAIYRWYEDEQKRNTRWHLVGKIGDTVIMDEIGLSNDAGTNREG